jgi:hypothetical protein
MPRHRKKVNVKPLLEDSDEGFFFRGYLASKAYLVSKPGYEPWIVVEDSPASIKFLREMLDCEYAAIEYRNTARLKFPNLELITYLTSRGLIFKKLKAKRKLDNIHAKSSAFWRGVATGIGCRGEYKNKLRFQMVGNSELIAGFNDWIARELGLAANLRASGGGSCISWSCGKALKVLEII